MKYNLLLLVLLLIILESYGQKCDSHFPKLLGGSYGTTELYDIDANLEQNLIVGVGRMFDYKIIGVTSSTCLPYIAAFSINSTSILWGYTDRNKTTNSLFQKVALSPNG